LPDTKEQERIAEELLSYLYKEGADGQCFAAITLSDKVEKDLMQRKPKRKSFRLLNWKQMKMIFKS